MSEDTRAAHKVGMFSGVFTPSILTILGVIMFLRAGFVVGQAGVSGALGILLFAEIIVVLTALSVAAIATNTQVHGGGAYYLISRVLGPEFGGAIGLTLFLAQSLSVPFYILGFAEAVVISFPALADHMRALCLIGAAVLFVINYIGVKWALNVQFFILALLGLAILAFMGGMVLRFDPVQFQDNWAPAYEPGFTFWVCFAIYFPAVTGIMAGINMSGNLRNPGRSLALGTLLAIGVGFLIYGGQILLLGGSAPRVELLENPYGFLILNALFGAGFLVVAGMFAASLSSAISSFMAAPRVMQAIARDRLLRPLHLFAKGSEKGDEPRRALTVTAAMTFLVLWWATGDDAGMAFNTMASIVTMFFLCTYLIINMAAFVEAFGSNPSFRPRFTFFHWSTALLGAGGSLLGMLLIHPGHAVIALTLIAALYAHMNRRVYANTFGDARRGFLYGHISKNLLRLRNIHPHPKNWRPTILVLSGNPETRLNLILYGVWFEAGRGIVTVARLLIGPLHDMIKARREALQRLQTFVKENDINAFAEVAIASDFDEGVRVMLQTHSIGPIKPNIVLMGWPSDQERIKPFVRHLGDVRRLGMSVVSVIDNGQTMRAGPKRVDIWWRGRENGSLMLILAHLLTLNWEWADTQIRILRRVNSESEREVALQEMTALVDASRIKADIEVIASTDSFDQIFRNHSKDAATVFTGFSPPSESGTEAFHSTVTRLAVDMPPLILVSSSGEADLLA